MTDLRLLDYGIDYLTLTRPYGEYQDDLWVKQFGAVVLSEWFGGNSSLQQEKWGWAGYVGWRLGPVTFGSGPQGYIFRVSGGAAQLIRRVRVPGDWKATRVDLQATWHTDMGADTMLKRWLGQAKVRRDMGVGRPYKLGYLQGFGAGDSVMLGSRASEKYVRMYNKSAREGEKGPHNRVRFEVEVKGDKAVNVWEELNASVSQLKLSRDMVMGAMDAYGIVRPEEEDSIDAEYWRSVSRETAIEGKLEWLEKQVAPTVRALKAAGYGSDALQALGLLPSEEMPDQPTLF